MENHIVAKFYYPYDLRACATLRVATLLTLESAQTLLREIRAEELAWSGIDPETVDILFALTNALNLSPTFHIEN
jgi:hypothetical protein